MPNDLAPSSAVPSAPAPAPVVDAALAALPNAPPPPAAPVPETPAVPAAPLTTEQVINQALEIPPAPDTGPKPEGAVEGEKAADGALTSASPTAEIPDDQIFSDPRVVARLQEAEPALEMHRAFNSFVQEIGATGEEVDNSLAMLKMLKTGDHKGFLAAMQPYLEQALQATGGMLAPDLQAAVDAGQISLDVAQAKQEARTATAQFEAYKQQQSAAAAKAAEDAMLTESTNFWNRAREADPATFAARSPLYRNAVAALASANPPKTPAEAVEINRQAREMVDKSFAAAAPAPKPTVAPPTMARPPAGSPAAPVSMPQLGTMTTAEAIQAALAGSIH